MTNNNVYLGRTQYLNWLFHYQDTPFIKVLAGMRRVGKSTLLQQFAEALRSKGIPEKNILFIDMESLEYRTIKDVNALTSLVNSFFKETTGKKILIIDEIQEILSWEKALASFHKTDEFDIYITGSNAHLLSSDLATFLTGRYVQIHIYSFSYSEYLQFHGIQIHSQNQFQSYIKYGGFPGIYHLPEIDDIRFQALNDLYSSIILRDIVDRYAIRNVSLLERIIQFFFDNMGQLVSARSITAYLKSQRIKVSIESVLTYISYLESCFALYRTKRYDIKGKRHLEINEKHYLGDIGLRHAILGYRQGDIGQLLENVVYLELKRRGYTVSVGIFDNYEIDFIAEKLNEKLYIQVAYILGTPETREREFRPLKKIQDSFPKLVLTMDELQQDEEGIRHQYLPEFLLSKDPSPQ